MSTQNKFGVWGWVAVFSIGGAVVLITESIGIHQKWEDVVVFTVLLFTTLILLYRACWGSRSFWLKLLLIFILHAIGTTIILQSVPIGSHGIPGLLMTAITMVEGVCFIVLLDRRTAR
jgi:hypothetical protein